MSLNRSILATSLTGASGAGGTLIYHHAVPWTWKEVLVKEGCYFLNADDEYKAVASEHKLSLKKISELQSIKQDSHTHIQNWCQQQLKANYVRDTKSYDDISNLCTGKGITTVKAKLISSGYGGFIEDEVITAENEKTERLKLYKAAFGIYRYYTQFITWIQEFSKEKPGDPYSKDTGTANGGPDLEKVCVAELNRPHKEISDINYYNQVYWWCKKLPYKDVKELIASKDPDWELAEEWTGKAEKWRNTPYVNSQIPKNEETQKIEDLNVKQWCTSNHGLELYQNDAYLQTYRIVKYVCKKEDDKKKSK